MSQSQFEISIENLNFALTLTDEPKVVEDINGNLALAHNHQGQKTFEAAIKTDNLEGLQKALEHFKAAAAINEALYGRQVEKTNLKMLANEFFDEGCKLEREAEELSEKGFEAFSEEDWEVLSDKIEDSLNFFKKCEEKLCVGANLDGTLEKSLKSARDAVKRVKEVRIGLLKVQLVKAVGNLEFKMYNFDENQYIRNAQRIERRIAEFCCDSNINYS